MNALYNLFNINLFDCISYHQEASKNASPELAAEPEESAVRGDLYVLSTSPFPHNRSALDPKDLKGEWVWPESFEQPADFLADPSKMEMIVKVQREIDAAAVEHNINYHTKAEQGNLTLSNLVILRYLEASQWKDPLPEPWKSCSQRILETIDWRVSVPLPVRDRALMMTELATGKFVVNGMSKNGRPVVYIRVGRENTWDPRGNLMALVYTMERAIAAMGPNTCETISIVDCSGVGMMNTPSTAFIKLAVEVMGKHYPRRNGQVFICNVARQKIQILTSDLTEMRTAIGALVDTSVLLREYGGDADDEFNVDQYMNDDPNMR